jgi:hypothetical protein
MVDMVNHGQQRSIMGLKILYTLVIAAVDSSESSDEDLKKSD